MNVTNATLCFEEKGVDENYWNWRNLLVNILAVFIIVSNTALILVIRGDKELRKQRFSLFIISLAITDLLCGIFIPFNTLRVCRWQYGELLCDLVTSMVVITMSSSVYNYLGVNIDRVLAIKYPLEYFVGRRWWARRNNVKACIALCWLLALLPAAPMWVSHKKELEWGQAVCSFPYENEPWVWGASTSVFIVPTLVILSTLATISYHLHRPDTRLRRFEEALPQEGYQLRVTLTLAAMTVVFLACWWPYGVIFMMEHSGDKGIILWNVVTLAYSNREECTPHLSSLQVETNS